MVNQDKVLNCECVNKLECALSNLYWLQKEQFALCVDLSNVLTRFINGSISFNAMTHQSNYLKESISNIQTFIDKNKDDMNLAIYQRIKNKRLRLNDSYYNRKIDNVSMKTFRDLSLQLYDHLLPKFCSQCGSIDKLHIHHLRYSYPPEFKDLVRLCSVCHSKLHSKLKLSGVYLR